MDTVMKLEIYLKIDWKYFDIAGGQLKIKNPKCKYVFQVVRNLLQLLTEVIIKKRDRWNYVIENIVFIVIDHAPIYQSYSYTCSLLPYLPWT